MLTSAAIFPNVSRPNCLREIKWLCAESNKKRRQVRLAAKSLTFPSSKERFRKITAIWSTRCPSISLMPSFRGGWNKDSQIHSPDVPSTTKKYILYSLIFHLLLLIFQSYLKFFLTDLPWDLFLSEIRSRTSLSSTMSFQNYREKLLCIILTISKNHSIILKVVTQIIKLFLVHIGITILCVFNSLT